MDKPNVLEYTEDFAKLKAAVAKMFLLGAALLAVGAAVLVVFIVRFNSYGYFETALLGSMNSVVLFFGVFMLTSAFRRARSSDGAGRVILSADEQGVSYTLTVFDKHSRIVHWADIKSFTVQNMLMQGSIICINLNNPVTYIDSLGKHEKAFARNLMKRFGTPVAVTAETCGTPAGRIAVELNKLLDTIRM